MKNGPYGFSITALHNERVPIFLEDCIHVQGAMLCPTYLDMGLSAREHQVSCTCVSLGDEFIQQLFSIIHSSSPEVEDKAVEGKREGACEQGPKLIT